MLKIREYKKVSSLEEAYTLSQKKNSIIIGGMLWLRMMNRNIGVAIDLKDLGLDKIEETDEYFKIGSQVTLRQIEQHVGLNAYTDGAIKESVKHIVGVQFRNMATVGGSIYGRYGFSDICTVFLGLDAEIEFYNAGKMSLKDYMNAGTIKDVLTYIYVYKKKDFKVQYRSIRITDTDFPVLTCALSKENDIYTTVIGSRPGPAKVVVNNGLSFDEYIQKVQDTIITGDSYRASANYRTMMIKVLMNRCLETMEGENHGN